MLLEVSISLRLHSNVLKFIIRSFALSPRKMRTVFFVIIHDILIKNFSFLKIDDQYFKMFHRKDVKYLAD